MRIRQNKETEKKSPKKKHTTQNPTFTQRYSIRNIKSETMICIQKAYSV